MSTHWCQVYPPDESDVAILILKLYIIEALTLSFFLPNGGPRLAQWV